MKKARTKTRKVKRPKLYAVLSPCTRNGRASWMGEICTTARSAADSLRYERRYDRRAHVVTIPAATVEIDA